MTAAPDLPAGPFHDRVYFGVVGRLRRLLDGGAARSAPSCPGTILVIAIGFLGDMVLLGPFLRALRRAYPRAVISLLVEASCALLVRDSPDIDRLLVFDASKRRSLRYCVSFISSVRALRFDLGIVHYSHFGFEYLLFLLGIGHLMGYDSDLGFRGREAYALFSRRVHKDWNRNEIENSFAFLRALGAPGEPEKAGLRVPVEADAAEAVRLLLSRAGIGDGESLVGLHIDAAAANKKWIPERWAETAAALADGGYGTVVITGKSGSTHDENVITARVRNRVLPLCGKLTLTQLIALVSRYRLLVTTDSGPKHFAYALGVPTVEIYGVSHSWRWGAYWDREIHVVLDRKADRRYVSEADADARYDPHIRQIFPAEVINAATRFFGDARRNSA